MAKKRVVGRKRKPVITNHDDDEKRPWSDLPCEILEMIKKQLLFIDQVNFHVRVVCKSWSSIQRIQPVEQIPWLLVFEDYCADSFKLVDSKDKKAYEIDAKAIKDKLEIAYFNALKVHESKYGWLLVSNNYKCNSTHALVLYNPFFNENFIELPILNDGFSYATFTSNPLDENCKILTLDINYKQKILLINTYRFGESSWSRRIFKCEFDADVKCWMYSEENIYYVTRGGMTGKFDLRLEEWNALPSLPRMMLGISTLPHHIVKSSDGVLFSILECNLKPKHDIWNHHSYIHRLDLSSMGWEKLDSIGDRVLFIGEGYHAVLDSSGLNLKRERIADKIYWCVNEELKYCSVYEYTAKISECGKRRKLDCSRHFGPIAKKRCKKMLIDPPPR